MCHAHATAHVKMWNELCTWPNNHSDGARDSIVLGTTVLRKRKKSCTHVRDAAPASAPSEAPELTGTRPGLGTLVKELLLAPYYHEEQHLGRVTDWRDSARRASVSLDPTVCR
jgi:hypothetical protein